MTFYVAIECKLLHIDCTVSGERTKTETCNNAQLFFSKCNDLNPSLVTDGIIGQLNSNAMKASNLHQTDHIWPNVSVSSRPLRSDVFPMNPSGFLGQCRRLRVFFASLSVHERYRLSTSLVIDASGLRDSYVVKILKKVEYICTFR